MNKQDFDRYDAWYQERQRVREENDRRIHAKFNECRTYVEARFPGATIVWTDHQTDIPRNVFYIWTGSKHVCLKLQECGIEPITLLEYPEYPKGVSLC